MKNKLSVAKKESINNHQPELIIIMAMAVLMGFGSSFVANIDISIGLLLAVGIIGWITIGILYASPKIGLWILLLTSFFSISRYSVVGGFEQWAVPFFYWGRWVPTFVIFFISVIFIIKGRISIEKSEKNVYLGILLFILLSLITFVLNNGKFTNFVLALALYLRYPLFYIILIGIGFSPEVYRRLIRWFIILGLIQIPVSIIQYMQGMKGDFLTGTLGQNESFMIVLVVVAAYLFAQTQVNGNHRLLNWILIILLLIPLVLAQVMVGFFLIPIVILFVALRSGKLSGKKLLQGTFTTLVIVGAGVILLIFMPGQMADAFRKLIVDQLWQPFTIYRNNIGFTIGKMSAARLILVPYAFPIILKNPFTLFFGLGPEAGSGGLGTSQLGIACQLLLQKGAFSCARPTQIYRTLMDTGLFGIVVNMVILLPVWLRNRKFFLTAKVLSNEIKTNFLTFDAIGLLFIVLAPWYSDAWRWDIYLFIFWFWAAALASERKNWDFTESTK